MSDIIKSVYPMGAEITGGDGRALSAMSGKGSNGIFRRTESSYALTNGEYRVCQSCGTPFVALKISVCPACGMNAHKTSNHVGNAIAYINSVRAAIVESLIISGKNPAEYAMAA